MTRSVVIPGLSLSPLPWSSAWGSDVVSYVISDAANRWDDTPTKSGGVMRRKVKHYGYRYDYERDACDARCRPFPREGKVAECLAWVEERFGAVNQCTVNKYEGGEGIGSHCDVACLGDRVVCLSFGGHAVMDFRRRGGDGKVEKSMLLEGGTCLVMEGEGRWEWEHAICQRKTDLIDGDVRRRGRRVSLTFRRVVGRDGRPLPRVVEGEKEEDEDPRVTPEVEVRHVRNFYDAASETWHHTRSKVREGSNHDSLSTPPRRLLMSSSNTSSASRYLNPERGALAQPQRLHLIPFPRQHGPRRRLRRRQVLQ